MEITGIICEYNPLHLGHKKQIDRIKAENPEAAVVCLMSGNYVQRGKPAIFHKSVRAKAALSCGADLVLELPVTAVLSSAEGFASEGVRILGSFCDRLCFGAETADADALMSTARALLSEDFSIHLKAELETGVSFPAARQTALSKMGLAGIILETPNNILAVEYCKAILSLKSSMQPYPILREGNYHQKSADACNPSATAVRSLIENKQSWLSYVPEAAAVAYQNAAIHSYSPGERSVLAKLRTMSDEEFSVLPFGSEGLWRKLMHASRENTTLEEILTATKSKRYTRTRLDRMVICAFLGLTAADLDNKAPYCRVLGLNNKGRQVLNLARQTGIFVNAGQAVDDPYQALENRCSSLFGLFCESAPGYPDDESKQRVIYMDA